MSGYYVSDMVDNNRDYVYYNNNKKEHFLRLTGMFTDETMDEFMGPALALFLSSEPFTPVYAMRLSGSFEDYEKDEEKLGRAIDSFYQMLEKNNIPSICSLALKLKNDKVADRIDYPFFVETDNQGMEMAGSYEYEGVTHTAYVVMCGSAHTLEYQLAKQMLNEKTKENTRKE